LLFCFFVLPFVVSKHFVILVFGLLVGAVVSLGFGQGLGFVYFIVMRCWVIIIIIGLAEVFGLLGLMECEVARHSYFEVGADRKDCHITTTTAVLVLVVVVAACFDMG